VEFSDFMCPYCRSLAGAFANYVPQSGNRVAVYFKNYPLDTECNKNVSNSLHPGACWLAMGGVCAQQQGRFWPYHDRVFATNFANPKREDVVKVATGAGLNTAAFESCLDTPQAREKLAAEIKEGAAAGVQATPTVFINGKKVPRMNDFTQMVDKEAARLGLPPLQRPAGR
jgi:protein-disulfide isomerase